MQAIFSVASCLLSCNSLDMETQTGVTEMAKFEVYANGTFWGVWEGKTADEAMQIAADEVGTVDVGQEHASTDGLVAVEVE